MTESPTNPPSPNSASAPKPDPVPPAAMPPSAKPAGSGLQPGVSQGIPKADLPKPGMPRRDIPKADVAKPNLAKADLASAGAAKPDTPRPAAGTSRSALAVFSGLGFLILVGACFYLWQRLDDLARSVDPVRVTVLESQVRLLQQRLTQLEQAPAPAPAAPPPDLRPIEQRLAALEHRPQPAPGPDVAPLAARVDALDAKLSQREAQAGQSIDRAARLAPLQVAATALEAGQPLGEIPGAPPALSRFAVARPPTEPALRLAFPEAARAAAEASRPGMAGENLAERIWTRMTRLVTVRAGDRVIVGAPAAVVLADAQRKLDAGDLGGAVAALAALDPPAAAAMADWRAQAQSLLDARAALTAMARG